MATLGKQEINDESIINKWGSMEDCWNKLVVGAAEQNKLVVGASEQGGWDRPILPGHSSSG